MPPCVARRCRVACVALQRFCRAEHIMGMPVAKARRWTAREVRQLIADQPLATPRYELVDGELLVTPSPGPAHQEAVARLLGILRTGLGRGHQWRGTGLTAKDAKSAKDCIVFGSG